MRFFVGATQVASLLRRSGGNAATEPPETLAARAAPTARSTGGWHSLAWSVSACATTPYTMRFFVGATQVASFLRRSGDNAATERPETLAARAAPTARSTGGWHSLAWSVSACATTPLYDAVFCRSDASRELFAAIGRQCRYGAAGNPRGLRRSYSQIHGWVAFVGMVGIRMRGRFPYARRLPYTMRFFVGATQVASFLRCWRGTYDTGRWAGAALVVSL